MSDGSVQIIENYEIDNLKYDLSAGFSVAAIALPQNMAYALIAGVAPIYGLYTSIVSMIVAVFVGRSSYMVVGPTNVMALAIASSLNFLGQENYLVGLFLLTLMVGVFQFLLGSLKLGKLVNYVPHSVTMGLVTGIALIIGIGQLNKLLGTGIENGDNIFYTLSNIAVNLNNINYYSLFIGLLTIIIIIGIQRYNNKLPSYLIAIMISMGLVYFFNLGEKLTVVESFSAGLPSFKLYNINLKILQKLIFPAFSTAFLGFIQVLSIIDILEEKSGEELELSKEFKAQGIINIICSFFQGFVISGSYTNTFANYEAGAKTRISELATAIFILIFVVFFSSFTTLIPITSLAAIVILVAYYMIEPRNIIKILKTSFFDRITFLSTFFLTILSPRLDYAVYLGLAISLIMVIKNTSEVNYNHIKYNKNKNYFTKRKLNEVKEDDYIIIDISGSLYFNSVHNLYQKLKRSYKENQKYIIRMRDVNDIDVSILKELTRFIDKVQQSNGEVLLSGVNKKLYSKLKKSGIIDKISNKNIYKENKKGIFESTKNAVKDIVAS